MRKILGLDIGSGSATAFLLEQIPVNIRDFVKSERFTPFEVHLNHDELSALIDTRPDLVILEPTGDHYEQVFCHWFNRAGIPYKRAVGTRVASFRDDKGLPKTDGIDAFSLALYGAIKLDRAHPDYDPKAFVSPCELQELRDWWLQRHGATQRRKRLVCRFRQQLARCIPEAQETRLDHEWGEPPKPLILWIAGRLEGRPAAIWDKRVNGGRAKRQKKMVQVPGTCGMGVDAALVAIASELLQTEESLLELESKIDTLLSEDRFSPYLRAFELVGASRNMTAIYMTRIYPLQRFMGEDGQPIIQRLPSKKTGKICTYDRSLAQFKAAIGAGTWENSSGTRQKRENRKSSKRWKGGRKKDKKTNAELPIGDRYCRQAFFLWGMPQIEGMRAKLVKNPDVVTHCDRRLIEKSQSLENSDRNNFQRLGNLQGYHARLLYRQLLKELKIKV